MFDLTIDHLRDERIEYFSNTGINKVSIELAEYQYEQLIQELKCVYYMRFDSTIESENAASIHRVLCTLTGYKDIIVLSANKVKLLPEPKTLILQKSMICYRNDPDFLETAMHICKKDTFLRFEEISLLNVKYSVIFNEIQEDYECDEIRYTFQIILSI